MHMIQAQILHHIVEYIQDKLGEEPDLVDCRQNIAGEVEVRLAFTISRDYPGISHEVATQS